MHECKNIKIFTMPHIFPKNILKYRKKIKIGFDPKLYSEKQLNFLFKIKNVVLQPINENLIDIIWSKKPTDIIKPFFSISKKNAGQSSQKKITKIKNYLFKKKIDCLLVTAPENVAWILNIRGFDSAYSPIPNSRLLINKNGDINLFSKQKKITEIKKKASKKLKYYSENKIKEKL